MKRKNYAFLLSFGVCGFILAPIFIVSFILFKALDLIDESNLTTVVILFGVIFLITLLAITLIFSFTFVNMKIRYENGVYRQGSLLVPEDKVMSIRTFRFFFAYAVEIHGEYDRLIDYFTSPEELQQFVEGTNLAKVKTVEEMLHPVSNVDKLWEMYGKNTLTGDIFYLLDYEGGINGEGHHCYFDNNEDNLDKISEALRNYLSDEFYELVHNAIVAYVNEHDDVSIKCDVADEYFHKHEKEIMDIIEKYANEYFKENEK